MELNSDYLVTTQEQLRAVIAPPAEMLRLKVFAELIEDAQEFLNEAPLLLLCTQDASGAMDVSPKGDAPGFVEIADSRTLIIPDRPGNKLAFGFENLIQNPSLSLIFLRPGIKETLRVNGTGQITRDPEILERFSVKGKPAQLCTVVSIDECFFHCGKALIRSKLWQPDSWAVERRISFGKQFAQMMPKDSASASGAGADPAAEIDKAVADDYENNLY